MNADNRNILVVDGDPTTRMNLQKALAAHRFTVTPCEDKKTAERHLRTSKFDVIILDVVLPDGDGIDLLRQIRTDAAGSPTFAIIASGKAEAHDRVRGLATGAVEYIGKPYHMDYLIQCVLQWTGMETALALRRGVGGKKILAVDDDPVFLRMLADALREDRHDVIVARSGAQALEILALHPVDCILIDKVMPGMDGLETSRRIKAIPERREIPILVLLENDQDKPSEDGSTLGVEHVVVKSSKFDPVRVRVRIALRRSRRKQGRSPDTSTPKLIRLEGNAFLEHIIAVSGISSERARPLIEEACGCLEWDMITPTDVLQSLSSIRRALGIYLSREEAAKRAGTIAAVARLAQMQRNSAQLLA